MTKQQKLYTQSAIGTRHVHEHIKKHGLTSSIQGRICKLQSLQILQYADHMNLQHYEQIRVNLCLENPGLSCIEEQLHFPSVTFTKNIHTSGLHVKTIQPFHKRHKCYHPVI